jgi:ankyrin repeat protein
MSDQLHELCEKEDFKSIRELMESHGDLSIDVLNMALRTIATTNNISIAQYLIDRGANCFTMALCEATCTNGTDDMISFLLKQGADYNDWTAMEYAIEKKEMHTVQLLIRAGFELWDKALLSSITFGHIEFVLLFQGYYHPSPTDVEQYTQLLRRHPNPELEQVLGLSINEADTMRRIT